MTSANVQQVARQITASPPADRRALVSLLNRLSDECGESETDQLFAARAWQRFARLEEAPARAASHAQRAAEAGSVEAALMLGAHLLRSGDQDREARMLLRRVANDGWIEGRLAYAHLLHRGIGGLRDEARSTTQWLMAAAQGDTAAFSALAYRYSVGLGAPRDSVVAGAWARLAALRGFPGARRARHQFDGAMGTTQRAHADDLAAQYREHLQALGEKAKRLETDTRSPAEYGAELTSLVMDHHEAFHENALSLDPDRRGKSADPPLRQATGRLLFDSPRVVEFVEFVPCDVRALLLRPTAASPGSDGSPRRDPLMEDPSASVITRDIAAAAHLPPAHVDTPWRLTYPEGSEFPAHVDYATAQEQTKREREFEDAGGQRTATAMLCLSSAIRGGAIEYSGSAQRVRQSPGDLLLHYNVLPCGAQDTKSQHGTSVVEAGERWSLRVCTTEHPVHGTESAVL